MTAFENASLWVGALGALATFLAVVAALFGERLRQLWTSPKLTLMLDEPAFTKTNDGRQGWYYLLRVENKRRSCPASNVRILITRIFKTAPDGSWHECRFSGPTQVRWRWPDQMPLYATVGPPEHATFGFLREDNDAFHLAMFLYPNNLEPVIPAKEPTRLEFKAVSDTTESDPLLVEVAWDGTWVAGRAEISEHLVVKVAPP